MRSFITFFTGEQPGFLTDSDFHWWLFDEASYQKGFMSLNYLHTLTARKKSMPISSSKVFRTYWNTTAMQS